MLLNILRGKILLLLMLPALSFANGGEIAETQCSACHQLEKPDFDSAGITERLQRKAPPLYYAGNKYRQAWLLEYLQSPGIIHPAGYFPATAVLQTDGGDIPDPDGLHEHLVLNAEEASAVTEFLMSLRSHEELIAADNYEPGSVAMRMGMMDFRRFKGCDACHQDAEDQGGFSGPRLYDAWQRLQPAYISSFIQDPTAWDPNTTMPVLQLNESAVHNLVHYLRMIGGEE